MDTFKEFLVAWNKRTDAFSKVQGGYAALAVALFFLAAVVSLMNNNLGRTMLFFSLISILTFVANGVMWALYRTFVEPWLTRKNGKPSQKARAK